jgi:2-hydroxy-3-oxopropionate reductase
MLPRIGFIGLGVMGKPMARNLLKAGYPVTVFNRSRAAMELLQSDGAELANSPAQLAQLVDVIITCVPDSPDVEGIVFGEKGILESVHPGMIFIDMSTIAAATSRKVYQALKVRGVSALDAPISGGDIGAQQGTLSIMVGGELETFDRALPIFQVMGETILHIGDSGAGQITKACNQIVVAMTIQCVAEALALAQKSGVDGMKVREALLGGFAQSKILEIHGQRMLDRNYTPGFKVDYFKKDLNIVLEMAKQAKISLPGSARAADLANTLQAQNGKHPDFSVLMLDTMLEGIIFPFSDAIDPLESRRIDSEANIQQYLQLANQLTLSGNMIGSHIM